MGSGFAGLLVAMQFMAAADPVEWAPAAGQEPVGWIGGAAETRRFLESDRAFPGFIGPISNPILSKDPRSTTEARLLFIHNKIDPDHPLFGSGDFQVYAMQVRLALTERLTFIADKDGYAFIHPEGANSTDGWLNINAGLRYLLVRDVENQFLWSAGFTFEPQTGEASVFQNQGDGVFSVFTTLGKEIACKWHALGTFGYQFPADRAENSSFFYTSLHVDRQWCGCFYSLLELNWFHWSAGGRRGIPAVVGEGDGLLNLGTSGVAGSDQVTLAVGLKAILGPHAETGFAFEVPVTGNHDLIDSRILVELILRY